MYKQVASIFIISVLLMACNSNHAKLKEAEQDYLYQLATPIQLDFSASSIFLSDYVKSPELIDSIKFSENIKFEHLTENDIVRLETDQIKNNLSSLSIFIQGIEYSILLKKTSKQKVNLRFDPKGKTYSSVQLKGQMNGWNPAETHFYLKDELWQTDLILSEGNYQYLLVVDGKEMLDPENEIKIDNNFGGFNSLLTVGKQEKNKTPFISASAFTSKKLKIESTNEIQKLMAFWNNHDISYLIKKTKENTFELRVPENADTKERSYLRVWAENSYGISNDLLVPLEFGKAICSPKQLKRTDKQAMTMYFLMVDRFNNGDKNNDLKVNDPEILPKANYFGGDLEGIREKINDGFFSSLGINTIWVSPITQNPFGAWGLFPDPKTKFSGYHGYWPISNKNVDIRFGSNQVFKKLVEEGHQKQFNILLDYVANHVHKEHPVYKQHPEWATDLYLPDGSLNTERWDEHRLTTWFDVFLPTLNLENPEVIEAMSDSALVWIEEFGVDGFRHDATKHIPEVFWRVLTKKLKNITKDERMLYQIGETYGNRELIGSYVNTGQMDGQFDFNVYDDAIASFGKDEISFERLANSLNESLKFYGHHNLMGYISGNQDRPRFISLAGGAVDWAEDTKKAGWKREIGVGDPIAYNKLAMLHAFNFTIPGIPVIYYGDEYGMPGANDPDNRRMMQFAGLDEKENNLLETTKKIIQLRKNNLALIYGDYQLIFADTTSYVYSRKYLNNEVVIAFNKSTEPAKLKINLPENYSGKKYTPEFNSEFSMDKNIIHLNLEAHSFEILTSK